MADFRCIDLSEEPWNILVGLSESNKIFTPFLSLSGKIYADDFMYEVERRRPRYVQCKRGQENLAAYICGLLSSFDLFISIEDGGFLYTQNNYLQKSYLQGKYGDKFESEFYPRKAFNKFIKSFKDRTEKFRFDIGK